MAAMETSARFGRPWKVAYGADVLADATKDMTEDEFLEAAGNVRNGVPIATPVFDGAKEADVNDIC